LKPKSGGEADPTLVENPFIKEDIEPIPPKQVF
jgi:hypothetical protein